MKNRDWKVWKCSQPSNNGMYAIKRDWLNEVSGEKTASPAYSHYSNGWWYCGANTIDAAYQNFISGNVSIKKSRDWDNLTTEEFAEFVKII